MLLFVSPPVECHTSLQDFCKVTLPVHLGCHMINGPCGKRVAWNTVTFALLVSSVPKVAGSLSWQCLLVLGHLHRCVCVHLEWLITPPWCFSICQERAEICVCIYEKAREWGILLFDRTYFTHFFVNLWVNFLYYLVLFITCTYIFIKCYLHQTKR